MTDISAGCRENVHDGRAVGKDRSHREPPPGERDWLVRLAARRGAKGEEADDAASGAYLRFLLTYDPDRSVRSTWLAHCLRQELAARRSVRPTLSIEDLPRADIAGPKDADPVTREWLEIALAALPERVALTFALRADGHSYEEIGSRVGIKPRTAKEYASVARRLLRLRLTT